jgi:hypothetical protein
MVPQTGPHAVETSERLFSKPIDVPGKDRCMAEATCRRELELEIPAEEVSKKIESVAKEFARIANVPGFRR